MLYSYITFIFAGAYYVYYVVFIIKHYLKVYIVPHSIAHVYDLCYFTRVYIVNSKKCIVQHKKQKGFKYIHRKVCMN